MKGRHHFGGQGINGRIILILILKKWGVERIPLVWDRFEWEALVNNVMKLYSP
jgi:hypothetical protein